MSREEFMTQLGELLSDITKEEKQEAMEYYRGYFEDAGEENEERIMRELESPKKVAQIIKADLGMEEKPESEKETVEFTENGCSDKRFEDKQEMDSYTNVNEKRVFPKEEQKKQKPHEDNKSLKIVLIVILMIVTSPIWISLAAALLGGAFGIAGGIFGIIVAVVAVAGSLYIAGIAVGGIGIAQLVTGGIAMGMVLLGVSLLIIAAAILVTTACVWIFGKLVPWAWGGIVILFRRIFSGKEEVK
ncbi:MAG: DUF1700 domain-containing protein [Lachnospiraceae bacterium]